MSWGVYKEIDAIDVPALVLTIGGALFGTGIGLLTSKYVAGSAAENNLSQFLNFLGEKKLSLSNPDVAKESVAGVWYCYNKSTKDHTAKWIETRYDIKTHPSGVISFVARYRDKANKVVPYQFEGSIRGNHLLLIGQDVGERQTPFLGIWPNLLDPKNSVGAGIFINKSWDGHDTLTSAILTRKRLAEFKSLSQSDLEKHLDGVWRKELATYSIGALALEDKNAELTAIEAHTEGQNIVDLGKQRDTASG